MKTSLICSLMVLLLAPLLAHAQAYKCKQANGSVSFQDHPCQPGTTGAPMVLPRPGGETRPPPETRLPTWQEAEQESRRKRIEAENRAQAQQEQKAVAREKMQRCAAARRDLVALKEARPVYSLDDKGNRQYVDDKDRASVLAEVQRAVAHECQ